MTSVDRVSVTLKRCTLYVGDPISKGATEAEAETQRHRDTETQRHRHRHRHRDTDRQTDRRRDNEGLRRETMCRERESHVIRVPKGRIGNGA